MSLGDAALLLAALIALAILIAVAMSFLFAWMTGWRALALRFPARAAPHPAGQPLSGLMLGEWGWNAPPLLAGFDEAGLVLVARIPFRFAFRPVHIPWAAVARVARRKYMFFDVVEVFFDDDARTKLGFVTSPLVELIERRLADREIFRVVPDAGAPETKISG